MSRWILEHEPQLRLAAFVSVFGIMALWEAVAERRHRSQGRAARWVANLGLLLLDSILVRLLFPAAAMGFAVLATAQGWGLFNLSVADPLPLWLVVALSMLLLDFAIYLQHWLFHVVPWLWRLHLVHHTDQDLDFTSGLRFHPGEIVLSMGVKFLAISLIGAPALSVLLFEVVLNATAIFNHSNVRLSLGLDRWLRMVMVTPDMHRVHHSVKVVETNSNFGFNLPWWDRLFGSYRAQPQDGHRQMQLGVDHLVQTKPRSIAALLGLPLIGKSAGNEPSRKAPFE